MGNLGYGAFPTHPGEVLKDEIAERGITQRQLADSMGLTYSVVNEILNGHRPLTAKTALMFEAAKSFKVHHLQLTSNPARVAANRLYQDLGFERYETNCYKLPLKG